MKKVLVIVFFLLFIINVSASSGAIKQDSIIECNGIYYGNHGNPTHWHIVQKKNDKWVIKSGEVDIPSCYIKPINIMKKVKFSKCIDGDTASFIINSEEKKVRFLAIDTPEVNSDDKNGKIASDYTCQELKKANEIYLEYDGNSDKEDKYGRVLAFVHVDGVLLEKKLIDAGLARVYYIYGDYNHVDELREAESIAKKNKLGIWSTETKEEETTFTKILNFIVNILKKIFDLLFK